ncbi:MULTISPECIES: hypothetical protein [unclassified Gordonia (in: high G+C Gram-positive bacteria)]|uniref:P-loop ATPase, Sll1717 family n=1 Tax=unclassified Gordonia (in: high G+C Gram-positive bacteria) TaxID=2657482 RepID=UPI0010F946BC|nr:MULTISPECIES: hypothetical protein [unclassified Gordonia (in: high G+C Gram-positive bacteria)]
MVKSVLDSVSFGRYDAESDANLLDYFLQTGASEEALSGLQLIVGRKGSGKTALFKYLDKELAEAAISLDLQEYVFGVHYALVEDGVPTEFAYTASWRLLIVMAMYARMRDHMDRKSRTEADEVLVGIGFGSDRGAFAQMTGWLRRLRKLELPSIDGFATMGSVEVTEPDARLVDNETIKAIQQLETLVAENYENCPVTVLIDRLDDAWDGSGESLNLITGAVRATRQLSLRMKSPKWRPAAVICFLRSDLWHAISFNDKNKMSQDMKFLEWDRDELIAVIERRIQATTGVPQGQAWDAVFSDVEMRQRAKSQTYLTKRTLGRPRDIIAFCDGAHRVAKRHGHNLIEPQDIYDYEPGYSRHLLDELRDEIERHVSDFNAVVKSLNALERRTFTRDRWFEVAVEKGMNEMQAEEALQALFEASAVGVYHAGGASGGSRSVYRYEDRFISSRDESMLQVHQGLLRELRLKE